MLNIPRFFALPVCMIAVVGCAAGRATVSQQTPARTRAETLLTQALPERVGTEGRVIVVDVPPGASTPLHRHDGVIFAYVAEGAVVSALDDGREERFEAGRAWYERPGQVHRVSRNASATKAAKLVVFFLTDPGKPVLRMEQ
jgi:quercetin dioxygenase-like cupin family protein